MSCRRGIIDNDVYNVVWFGSYGLNSDGTAKTQTLSSGEDINYGTNLQALVDALSQKLSVLKNELWWDIEFGLPLTDKINRKTIMDLTVMSIITKYDDVIKITNFSSKLNNKEYGMSCTIVTKYGTTDIIFE